MLTDRIAAPTLPALIDDYRLTTGFGQGRRMKRGRLSQRYTTRRD